MKKIIKMIMSTALILAISFMPIINVKAAEIMQIKEMTVDNKELGELIWSETYVDEYGNTVTESTYFYSDSGISPYSASGSGEFTTTKEVKWNSAGISKSTYYAKGYFTWGNGTVNVTNQEGGIDYIPQYQTMSNESLETSYGKYAGIFNDYAAVIYSFTMTSDVGMSSNYSVTVRVSQSGNKI